MTTHVGFTGTQHGMTERQKLGLRAALSVLKTTFGDVTFHHGDCIGADAEAHAIAVELGYRIHIHPPTDQRKRAFCVGYDRAYSLKSYLERNRDIVRVSDCLLACPKEHIEQQRSGTWYTIRQGRRRAPDFVSIINP